MLHNIEPSIFTDTKKMFNMTLIQVAHPARTIFSRTECQNALLETSMLRTFRQQT